MVEKYTVCMGNPVITGSSQNNRYIDFFLFLYISLRMKIDLTSVVDKYLRNIFRVFLFSSRETSTYL